MGDKNVSQGRVAGSTDPPGTCDRRVALQWGNHYRQAWATGRRAIGVTVVQKCRSNIRASRTSLQAWGKGAVYDIVVIEYIKVRGRTVV